MALVADKGYEVSVTMWPEEVMDDEDDEDDHEHIAP
jgi:hypothetical protein